MRIDLREDTPKSLRSGQGGNRGQPVVDVESASLIRRGERSAPIAAGDYSYSACSRLYPESGQWECAAGKEATSAFPHSPLLQAAILTNSWRPFWYGAALCRCRFLAWELASK